MEDSTASAQKSLVPVTSDDLTGSKRCCATRQDGRPCTAYAVEGGELCFFHSPEFSEARRQGGFNSSRIARLEKRLSPRLKPILELLERAMQECHEGTLPATRASAIAALATAYIKVTDAALMESRLEQLEEKFSAIEGEDGKIRRKVTVTRRTPL